MFKIERVVSKGDYLYAVCSTHPNRTKNNYVLLHRVLVENALGRLLTRKEVVHHKNNDKKDNRLENLEILSASDHAKEHAKDRPRKYISLICPFCNSQFTRAANQIGGRINVFCSRRCNAKYSQSVGKWLGNSRTAKK